MDNAYFNYQSDTISSEEAEWTRQALGLSIVKFAELTGISVSSINKFKACPRLTLKRKTADRLRSACSGLVSIGRFDA